MKIGPVLILVLIMTTTVNASSVSKERLNDFWELVKYAVRAPSGHNTQPWTFVVKENAIEVHPDWSRVLPVVDSDNRELYISLGCAVENLCVAATAKEYSPSVRIVNGGKNACYIVVSLTKKTAIKTDPLFDAIEKRQTNRSKYDGRIIPETTVDSIKQALILQPGIQCYFYNKASSGFAKLEKFVEDGNEIQMADSEFKKELEKWMRYNDSQAKKDQDGLTNRVMGFPGVPAFIGKPIVGSQLKASKQNKSDVEKINSSSHLILLTTTGNEIVDWIALGQTMERLLLKLTSVHVCNAYVNQPCEVRKISEKISSQMFGGKEHPMILMRVGYAKPVPYSLRRDVSAVLSVEN